MIFSALSIYKSASLGEPKLLEQVSICHGVLDHVMLFLYKYSTTALNSSLVVSQYQEPKQLYCYKHKHEAIHRY